MKPATSRHVQHPQPAPTNILVIIGLVAVTMLVSVFDYMEVIPAFSRMSTTLAFQLLHSFHDVLAVALAIFVAYRFYPKLGAGLIILFVVIHAPYYYLKAAPDLPELALLLVTGSFGLISIALMVSWKQAHYLFQKIRNASSVGVYIVQDGKFCYVNPQFLKIVGYAEGDLLHTSPLELVHPEDMSWVKQTASARLKSMAALPYEFRTITKDRNIRWVLESVTSIQYRGKRATLGNFMDITDRKEADKNLLDSERRYHSLFDNMLEGYAYCQMLVKNGSPDDFVYLEVNDAFEKLTGLKNVAGRQVTEVIPGIKESNPELFEIYGRVSATGLPESFETWVESLGMWFSVSVYGVAKGYFVATFDNITKRKQAEEMARKQAARTEALYRVSRGLADTLEMHHVAELALHEALKVSGLDAGIVRALENNTKELWFLFSEGLPPELEAEMRTKAGRLKLGQGMAGVAAQGREPLLVEDIQNDPRCQVPDLVKFGFNSAVYLPLRYKDEVVGIISGYSKQRRTFSLEDLELLTSLGTMVGMAMAHASLFEKERAVSLDWRQTFDAMNDGVALVSTEYRILRANWALARMLGTTPRDLIGKPCHEMVHGLDRLPDSCPLSRCLTEKRACEVVIREPHLNNHWFQMRVDPQFGPQGQIIRMIHTFRDVSAEKRREAVMERLHNLSLVLSSTLDLDKVTHLAMEEIEQAFGGANSTLGIALLDKWNRNFQIAAAAGPMRQALEGVSLPLNHLLPEGVHALLQEKRTWIQPAVSKSSQALRDLPGFLDYGSFLAVPMVADSRTTGVLFMARTEPGKPPDDEVALLETYARQIGLSVQSAQLFTRTDEALRLRVSEQGALMSVLASVSANLDIEITLHDALHRAATALGVDRASVLTVDETGERAIMLAAYVASAEAPQGIGMEMEVAAHPWLQAVLSQKRATVVEDAGRLPDGNERDLLVRLGIRSAMRLPIVAKGKAIGTLQFGTFAKTMSFSTEQLSLAQAFADHLASAIENARLHDRTVEERATLESIISSMAEGLVVVDTNRTVLYCNTAAELLLNIRRQDAVGRSVDLFQEALGRQVSNVPALQSAWKDGLSRLDESPRLDFEIGSGQTKRNVEVTLFAIGDKEMRSGTGVLLRDVTREREVDKMKTEFISMASHELRTPMTSVYGFAELLLMRAGGLTEDQRQWVEIIYNEGKRLSDIIEDLLNVSRIEAGRLTVKLDQVDLTSLVKQVIEQLRLGHDSHTFSERIAEGLLPVLADQDKLRQVLSNLVDNAVKYSPQGGPVVIEASLQEGMQAVVIRVSDHGLGIPQEDIPKLFTRFHRVSRPETVGIRGTGLGLYIVKSLVEMMGGTIWVVSEINKGSTFFVSLPVAERRTPDTVRGR